MCITAGAATTAGFFPCLLPFPQHRSSCVRRPRDAVRLEGEDRHRLAAIPRRSGASVDRMSSSKTARLRSLAQAARVAVCQKVYRVALLLTPRRAIMRTHALPVQADRTRKHTHTRTHSQIPPDSIPPQHAPTPPGAGGGTPLRDAEGNILTNLRRSRDSSLRVTELVCPLHVSCRVHRRNASAASASLCAPHTPTFAARPAMNPRLMAVMAVPCGAAGANQAKSQRKTQAWAATL